MKNKLVQKTKRLLSGIVATAIAASMLPTLPAMAEETTEKYPYTLFAGSSEEGAITVNAGNFCVNGNVATNGTIVSSGNMNINGTKTENADEAMIFIFDKIDSQYFSTSNVDEFTEDYTLEEINININTPTDVMGETTLTGNININTALQSLEDINLYGEVKNTNDSLIFSKYGDIIIDSQNVNLNGLVYAPFGDVEVTAQNLNLNNVVIIADTITLNCPNVNANYSSNAAEFVGTSSEPSPVIMVDKENLIYHAEKDYFYASTSFTDLKGYLGKSDSFESFKVDVYDVMNNLIYTNEIARDFKWKDENIGLMAGLNKVVLTASQEDGTEYTYVLQLMIDSSRFVKNLQVDLEDNDGDILWNYIEIFLGTDPDKNDTDDDGIDDWTEVYVLGYNPILVDTDNDGILDGDEDEDEDGLTNAFEVNEFKSSPIAADTDHEGLTDDEEYKYGTSPNTRDTDEDNISDYDEIYLFDLDPTFTNPSDIQLTKTFTVDDMSGGYDEAVYPTITLRGDADCITNFVMTKTGRTTAINPSAVGYLGAAYNFSTSGRFDGATLTFTYDPELIDAIDQSEEKFQPTIYYFNEETCDIEEVPNQKWEGNQVTAELEHFSVYLLMNKKALEFFWNASLDLPEETPVCKDNQIAFVLDNSGSMDWNDRQNIRGQLTKEFCLLLEPNDSVSIYGFNNYITNYNDNQFISDATSINLSVDKFINAGNSGGTRVATALNGVYADLVEEKNNYEKVNGIQNNALSQYVFLLTDGVSSDTPSEELLNSYNDAGIKIYTVGFGDADLMYLKRISDATGGQSYSADSSSNLSDIFLKFNDEIDATDENNDGISDYYEYLMCTGIITTRTGTKVFDGYTYEEIMANADLDGDGLKNGEEVFVTEMNSKPYASLSSNPVLINSDRDSYDDYEESKYGTSSFTVNYLVSQEDYTYLLNGSNFVFTTNANKYLNEWAGTLAFEYFIDVVFCGSESYFDTIKQGVQDGYYVIIGEAGKVGSENMLMKQNKALLAEYLGKLIELPNEQTQAEMYLNSFMDTVDSSLDFYDSVESVMQFVKQNDDYAISDNVLQYLTNKELESLIKEERREIARLQSELAHAQRESRVTGTLTPEKVSEFANQQSEISRRQSEIDRNIFSDNNSPAIKNRYKNVSDKIEFGLEFAQIAYSRFSQLTELIKYSQQLAAFEQYKEFITELSKCYDDHVAVAAQQLIQDLNDMEESGYTGRGAYEFFMGTLSDAFDIGLDVVIDKCGGSATAVFEILKFVTSAVIGQNLSYERENLISANLSSQITLIASNEICSICDTSNKLGDGNYYYVASGVENCVDATKYMTYYIVTRWFGEEKYVALGNDRSGLLGFFGYNKLVDKYGSSSVSNAEMHAEELSDMIEKYNKVFGES